MQDKAATASSALPPNPEDFDFYPTENAHPGERWSYSSRNRCRYALLADHISSPWQDGLAKDASIATTVTAGLPYTGALLLSTTASLYSKWPPCAKVVPRNLPNPDSSLTRFEHSSKSSASRKSQASTEPGNEPRIRTSTGLTSEVTKASNPLSDPTLHEDIYTLPNILTFSRLLAAPFIGYFVLHDSHAWAAGMLAYAGVTDLLDGWIARRWNRKTVVGTVIDPMADKVLMTVLTVCLAVKGALPVWVASIILGRDVGLGIAAIYYRWISLPPPKTFTRYWDFSLPSAEVRPTTISKYNTFLQLALVGVTTAAPLVPVDLSQALMIMQYVVAATTIWSGASYVYTKDAVKILSAPNKQKSKQ